MTTSAAQSLIDKLSLLPPEQLAEVEDFVDFLRMKMDDRSLAQAASLASKPAFASVWAMLHREELRADWERAASHEPMLPIQPLE